MPVRFWKTLPDVSAGRIQRYGRDAGRRWSRRHYGKKLRVSPKGWILASEKKSHDADDFPSAGFHKILPGNFISEGWQNHGTVLLRAISRGCTQLVEVWRQNCANTIRRKMVDKVMRMAYDKDEQPSTLDEMGKIQAGEGCYML